MGSFQPEFQNPATASLMHLARTRRTYYSLKGESPIPDETIELIVRNATTHVPTSFNTQSSRVVLLFKEEHRKVWDIALSAIQGLVQAGVISKEMYEGHTKPKLNAYKAAYGTVLFFVDYGSLASVKEKYTFIADKHDPFALEANAMAEYLVWMALESEGLGASLQHYNPLIDDGVRETWDLPVSWKLEGQIVFGAPAEEPEEKTFDPIEPRFKVFGK